MAGRWESGWGSGVRGALKLLGGSRMPGAPARAGSGRMHGISHSRSWRPACEAFIQLAVSSCPGLLELGGWGSYSDASPLSGGGKPSLIVQLAVTKPVASRKWGQGGPWAAGIGEPCPTGGPDLLLSLVSTPQGDVGATGPAGAPGPKGEKGDTVSEGLLTMVSVWGPLSTGMGGLPATLAPPHTTPPPAPGILCSRALHPLAPMAQIQSRWAPATGLGCSLHELPDCAVSLLTSENLILLH